MKRLSAVVILLLLTFGTLSAQAGRYLVATRRPAREARLAVVRDAQESIDHGVRQFAVVEGFAADLTDDEVAELRKSPEVRYVSPVVERHILEVAPAPPFRSAPNSLATSQTVPYGIDMIHARQVWPATKGRGTVNVAIIDTGIDYHHPDLADNYQGGWNVIAKNADPFDDNHHGTHVAGILAAEDNNIGVVGVAPEAKIWAVKVLSNQGTGLDEDVVAGIEWVIQQKQAIGGNWIISMSIGSPTGSDLEQEVIQRAVDAGILVIAAAGNAAIEALDYPAAYPGVLSVGAVDAKSTIAPFSSYGQTLGIAAPGVDILSTYPVNSVSTADVQVGPGGDIFRGAAITGTPRTDVTGDFIFCGTGRVIDFQSPRREPGSFSVAGKIALIKRGDLTFNQKVRNAKAAGASAVIIYNKDSSEINGWTLIQRDCQGAICVDDPGDVAFDWPLTIALSNADGEALRVRAGQKPIIESFRFDSYGILSGTSMSTPHVSGTAALLWALAPDATALQIQNAILSTAQDLGASGYDKFYGYGLLNAYAAARYIAPARFSSSVAQPVR
ncbi:MAG TPA: S8 family serine peptidase [Thermoanaerobaculia bacterium]|nr:S8 family serine peptidase [Thermoanaerobaculia bacterium]